MGRRRDGANVAIAAKTTEPNPKLPGTIFTAAEEIEQAGGKALPLQCDIRDEEQVIEAAVEDGRGASAASTSWSTTPAPISLTPTLDTPMKRYDLMHGVNIRGTFLCSQACLPYLKKSQAANPHILNLSPPLNMDPKWFAPHVAYTMAKYGMSMCVLGHGRRVPAVRHRGQRAVAAHGHRHRGARRCSAASQPRALPQAGDHGRRRLRDPDRRPAASAPATSSSTTRSWRRRE